MPVWSILLRVALSVALVLNGATGAFAATRMQMSHDAPTITADAVEKAAVEAPCHEMSGMAHTSPATDLAPEPSKHAGSECCKFASCTCMCMQGVQAPPAYAVMPIVLVNHNQSVRPLLLGHTSPALPHPNRPPIG